MFKVKCRCAKSEKNFKFEIGPFYMDECCKSAGYDDLGRPIAGSPAAEVKPSITDKVMNLVVPQKQPEAAPQALVVEPVKTEAPQGQLPEVGPVAKLRAFFGVSKSKLSRLRIEELTILAKGRNLLVSDNMTRAQLIELLLK